jgi:hypothetical protein
MSAAAVPAAVSMTVTCVIAIARGAGTDWGLGTDWRLADWRLVTTRTTVTNILFIV